MKLTSTHFREKLNWPQKEIQRSNLNKLLQIVTSVWIQFIQVTLLSSLLSMITLN